MSFHDDTHNFVASAFPLSGDDNLSKAGAPADVISAGLGVVLYPLVLEGELPPESGVTSRVLEAATSERQA